MRSTLPDIAAQLGADARTLRRAAERGAVHHRRPGPRSLELVPGELSYLQSHWQLLSALTRAFRTEPNVDLAVLYGSAARGSEHARSDVDILVAFRDDADRSTAVLARRLEKRIGITVDVASLSHVRKKSPLLLLQVVNEGRVLIDRGKNWDELRRARETIARAARRQMDRGREQVAESLTSLLEEPR
jgi:predicted nucleotidyltransferase